jgi:hypothetical protein
MSARDMGQQGSQRRRLRRRCEFRAQLLGGRETSCEQADGGAFHITFATGDLAGKAQARLCFEAQAGIQQPRRVEIGVAMQAAKAGEFGALQSRNHAEYSALFAVAQLGLEPDHVEQRTELVVLPKLNHRIGLFVRSMRIGKTDRLHRPETQRLPSAFRHHFNGQTAVEIGRVFPLLELDLLGSEQRVNKRFVLRAIERAVDIVCAGTAGSALVIARLKPGDREIDGIPVHDRSDRIEKGEGVRAGSPGNCVGQRG